ncbi:unnamed protein product [Blepharisma stoltei]|uniref:Uncharacterized protein n=1 Tax=Blepharisma stoltei TaxID=1481888 RepID=A0AAU9JGM3_9CILI|nr:unnamed protein product [Blepharisma stoltei]
MYISYWYPCQWAVYVSNFCLWIHYCWMWWNLKSTWHCFIYYFYQKITKAIINYFLRGYGVGNLKKCVPLNMEFFL